MSGKDILKLLLISYGFTKINIETFWFDGKFCYEIQCSNPKGLGFDFDFTTNKGLMFAISYIIQEMDELGVDAISYDYWKENKHTIKELLKTYE